MQRKVNNYVGAEWTKKHSLHDLILKTQTIKYNITINKFKLQFVWKLWLIIEATLFLFDNNIINFQHCTVGHKQESKWCSASPLDFWFITHINTLIYGQRTLNSIFLNFLEKVQTPSLLNSSGCQRKMNLIT